MFTVYLLMVDHGYYWFHRLAHEWHIIWAAHSVHHTGQYYNLSTALRQGAVQDFWSWWIYLPMALLGFSPVTFLVHKALNTLYQFW